jgi:hypothetical protein
MQEARSQREERFTMENMENMKGDLHADQFRDVTKKVGGGSGRYYSRSAAYYTS